MSKLMKTVETWGVRLGCSQCNVRSSATKMMMMMKAPLDLDPFQTARNAVAKVRNGYSFVFLFFKKSLLRFYLNVTNLSMFVVS